MNKNKFALKRNFIYGYDFTEIDDQERIIFYDSLEDAQTSLDSYIDDVNDAFKNGDLSEPYNDDIIIVEIPYNEYLNLKDVQL